MHVEIPIMESFRKWWLQGFKKLTSPLELCSYDGKVTSLVAEGRMHQLFINQVCAERDGIDTMSSGSMSPGVNCGTTGTF